MWTSAGKNGNWGTLYPASQTELNFWVQFNRTFTSVIYKCGCCFLRNSAEILDLGPHLCTRIWISTTIDWHVKNSIVNLAIRLKGNSKRISGNLSSPLRAPKKDLVASLLSLLTGVKLRLQRRLSVGLSKLDRLILLVLSQFKSPHYNFISTYSFLYSFHSLDWNNF